MALLDQIDRGGYWLHGGTGFYVHSVQSLRSFMQEMEGLQQNYCRSGTVFLRSKSITR